jgi:hypothetical protein
MILDLLQRITNLLESKKIDYMLSGSLALNAYSLPRMSLDIDFVIEIDKNNVEDFISIFDEHYYFNKDVIIEETNRRGMFNIIDHQTGFKIDYIVRKDTEYHSLEFERKRKLKITDFDVWIVSPEDLIISKIEWIQKLKSEKQINDIKNLLAIPKIDRPYIQEWCNKLKLQTYELI